MRTVVIGGNSLYSQIILKEHKNFRYLYKAVVPCICDTGKKANLLSGSVKVITDDYDDKVEKRVPKYSEAQLTWINLNARFFTNDSNASMFIAECRDSSMIATHKELRRDWLKENSKQRQFIDRMLSSQSDTDAQQLLNIEKGRPDYLAEV